MASSNYTLSISAASKHKDAATEFLEWMAGGGPAAGYYELLG